MFNIDKKTAFTLAEVLVTLGLIGAVSALTIPTLAYNYRSKVLEEQFRSTYSDVKQIGSMINYEKGDVGEYANGMGFTQWQKTFVNRLNGGNNLLRVENAAQIGTEYRKILKEGGGSPGPWLFNLAGNGRLTRATLICDNGSIWLDSKGRLWTFNSEMRIVCVDVNGTANPNRLNIDTFAFIPMNAKAVATYVYNDPTHPDNYSGAMVLCDLNKITTKAWSNIFPQKKDDGSYDTTKNSAYNACPFNEPVENIAALNSSFPRTSAKNRIVNSSHNYWKDYIEYK